MQHKGGDQNAIFYKGTSAGTEAHEALYDLHADHVSSGALDRDTLPYVLPRWTPSTATLAQIPNTFPLKVCTYLNIRQYTLHSLWRYTQYVV